MSGIKPRLLLGHTYWGRGGAEIAAMWLIQSLLPSFSVDIVTRGGWDLESLNAVAGTSVGCNEIRILKVTNLPGGLAAIAHGMYLRHARAIGDAYDLRVTASGVQDWGGPAIHFLSSVTWNDDLKSRFMAADAPNRRNLRQRLVWAASGMAAGNRSSMGAAGDLYIANSEWTAQQSAPFCPGTIKVIYPPVVVPVASPSQWSEREDAVVCLGRVSAEKDIESCIEIVESIRGAGFPLKLYIVGEMGPDRYGRRIEDLCRARRDWIVLPGAVYGAEKWSILQRCRYGISACRVEAFGIATAEMSASGMIVFVPAGCAQTEIVTNPNQTYTTLESAVCKFLNILKEERLQEQFRSESKLSVRKFSTDVFATRVAATFHDYIDTSLSRRARQVP